MSRPPNPSSSSHHTRAPSQDLEGSPPNNTGHSRRASTHSIPVSYAYGAPSVGKPRTPARVGRAGGGSQAGSPSVGSATASARGGGGAGEQEQEEEQQEWTGRSTEPAAVRYARVKQRQKDTGVAFPSPAVSGAGLLPAASLAKPRPPGSTPATGLQNTSVNIATAFREATAGRQPVGGPAPRVQQERQEEEEEEEDGGEEEGSGKETHVAGGAAGASASKKRKKRSNAPKDPSFKHRQGETTESESGSEFEDGVSGGKAKKARTVTEDGEAPPSTSKKSTSSTHTRRKSHIPSDSAPYRPSKQSSGSSSDSGSDLASSTHRRRKSKGKGRGSGAAGGSQAIPIGRRDGEVWFGGKKRKGRKGKRGSGEGSVGVEGEEEGEGQDMGGMEDGDFINQDHQDEDEDEDATPAPTSYFLRLKSPSPAPSGSTTTGAGANHLSPGAHSPFQPSRIFNHQPSPDPVLAAFDHSLASTSNSNSNDFSSSFHLSNTNNGGDRSRRSPSFDASIVSVRTDHDYEEEERIVRALEEQKRAGSLGKGQQGGGTGLRRRMPGPPGTSVAASTLGEILEEEPAAEGGVGKRLGEGVRPVWRAFEKVAQWARNPLIDWGRVGKALAVLVGVLWLYFALRSTPTPPPSTPSRPSWNPFARSPSTPFTAPDIPADSLPALISRLTLLESAMGELSTLSTSERTRSSSDRQLLSQLGGQVGALQQGLEGEREKARKAIEEGSREGRKEAKELERTIKSVKTDLDSLVARVRTLDSDRQADASSLRHLQSSILDVGKEIASLGTKVAQVSKDVNAGVDGERIARIALEAIEEVLPSKLAVRMDGKGKLEIDPAFWRHLKDAFAGKGEVERIVKAEVARLPSGGSSKEPSQVIVKEPPSWDDFLAANEVSLRTWVTSDLASRTGSDAIVSKRTFVEMLRKELKALKAEFEAKANENVEKIGQELLGKVAKQEEMKKKDSLASHLNPFHRSNNPSTITVKTPDGQNLTSIITTLVDSALLRYSKDVLARPDFALYTAGARVIRSLTSPTYSPTPLTRTRRALAWISGTHLPQGRAPITALHPDTSPGACWPFEGQQGQLGIRLSRRIVPSDISIEHVSVDVAVDGEVRSAPREWEMWGVVEGGEDVRRLEEYRKEARLAAAAGSAENDDDALEKALATSIHPTPNHLLLAQGLYDTTLPSPVQTFPVTSEARQLAIPVQTVVLRVRSNHGERAFTCLYRVRVSGRTEEMVKREAESEEEA